MSVEFQAGIESIALKKDTIEVKLVLPNAGVVDSGLAAWLNEAQRAGTLHTVAVTAGVEDEDTESQLRLFEDLMVENAPPIEVRQTLRELGKKRRRALAAVVADGGSIEDVALENDREGEGASDAEH